jgi:DNA-directed RNA polymerase beta subunit
MTSQQISDDDTFHVVQKFYEENGHLRQHIEAANIFSSETIGNVIAAFGKNIFTGTTEESKHRRYIFEITNFVLDGPRTTPSMCLMKRCNYEAKLYADILITPPTGEPNLRPKTFLGCFPVMVFSNLCSLTPYKTDERHLAQLQECVYEKGGYFVTKVISKDKNAKNSAFRMMVCPQERATPNRICVYKLRKAKPNYSVFGEVRSTSPNGYQSVFTVGLLGETLSCILPRFNKPIPIGFLFFALGIDNYTTISNLVFQNVVFPGRTKLELLLQRSLEQSFEFQTQLQSLEYIGRIGKESIKKKKKKGKFSSEADLKNDEEEMENNALKEWLKVSEEYPDVELMTVANKKDAKEKFERESAISFAKEYLRRELFSHLTFGIPNTDTPSFENVCGLKSVFFGNVINEVFLVIDGMNPTDRDHFKFKRIMDVNVLLEQQLRGAFAKQIQEIRKIAEPALDAGIGADIYSAIKPSIITNAMIGAIASNSWSRGTAKGVSQPLEQLNYIGGEQNKSKTKAPTAAQGSKLSGPRDIHPSHYMATCPAETPDNDDVGLTKNRGLISVLSRGLNQGENTGLMEMIKRMPGYIPIDDISQLAVNMGKMLSGEKWIYFNGDLVGKTTTPDEFTTTFRDRRRHGDIPREVGILNSASPRNTIRINSDQGRWMYPALIVGDDHKSLCLSSDDISKIMSLKFSHEYRWSELCSNGFVELIDKDEEENILLASYPSDVYSNGQGERKFKKYTHCEIHPSMMYGIGASIVPFADHNQSPRNCFQANMGRQAIGVPFSNYRNMLNGSFSVLDYIQRPLTLSRGGVMVGFNNLPAGINSKLVVMPHPFNEEDSIIMKRSSIQRGFMNSTKVYNFFIECRNQERLGKPVNPDPSKGDFSKIQDNGIVALHTRLRNGDVIASKIISNFEGTESVIFPVVYKEQLEAVVDKIVYGKTDDGYDFVNVMVLQRREPIIGDKFAARHSQKGTIGMIVDDVDMPFDAEDGTSPDIIINSLAFPSRMTIAMLIELMTGTAVCTSELKAKFPSINSITVEDINNGGLDYMSNKVVYDHMFHGAQGTFENPGTPVDATAFRKFDFGVLKKELERLGIPGMCSKRMYNGITGKYMESLVFEGMIYYERLKHMVVDKIHARQRGGKTTITRQPTDGRRLGGGMRSGVQERDQFLGIGAPHIARDRLFTQSDKYAIFVCEICGMQANVKYIGGKIIEKKCDICSTNNVARVGIPYGTKLVMQELGGMGVFARILTKG